MIIFIHLGVELEVEEAGQGWESGQKKTATVLKLFSIIQNIFLDLILLCEKKDPEWSIYFQQIT